MAVFSPVFSCFFLFFRRHEKPAAARPQARSRNEKPGAARRPGSWRSFGEYALLEDSRYTSQAENSVAIKSLGSHGIAATMVPSASSLSTRTRRDIVSRIGRFEVAKAEGG